MPGLGLVSNKSSSQRNAAVNSQSLGGLLLRDVDWTIPAEPRRCFGSCRPYIFLINESKPFTQNADIAKDSDSLALGHLMKSVNFFLGSREPCKLSLQWKNAKHLSVVRGCNSS